MTAVSSPLSSCCDRKRTREDLERLRQRALDEPGDDRALQDATAAETALDTIKAAIDAVQKERDAGRLVIGEPEDLFTDEMLKTVGDLRMHNVGARELEQLLYDVEVKRRGDQIVVETDEIDVQVFVKLLLSKGARIEMYSAHDHPDGAESA